MISIAMGKFFLLSNLHKIKIILCKVVYENLDVLRHAEHIVFAILTVVIMSSP